MENKAIKLFVRGLFRVLLKIVFRVKYIGEKSFPDEGPYIICSNHISMVDIPILACFAKGDRWIYFMAKKEFFSKPFTKWLFTKMSAFPVDRGNADIVSIRTATRYLKGGNLLGIFPQGTRSKADDALPGRKGPAMLASLTEAKIIPVLIEGQFKFRSKIKVYIGKPFDLGMKMKTKYSKQVYQDKSQEIMKAIYALPEVY
ncbi:MAG: 1-acyl-sn-glycerol-3-phosphate acyltransferase [Clostridia bacterium]|nr:1-acyl-sn-glycerol-3-phosphate acyltransferase [Clostridia bacterium]